MKRDCQNQELQENKDQAGMVTDKQRNRLLILRHSNGLTTTQNFTRIRSDVHLHSQQGTDHTYSG